MSQTQDLPPSFPSRLPNVGTTIFTVMSALATEHQAINLGQGFPDFPCDRKLIESVNEAMLADHNQYPPMIGIPKLRQEISQKIQKLYGHHYDADSEITITAGGTQGILTAVLACVSPGDEVIIIEPAYDSYRPSIELAGGIVKAVSLQAVRDENGQVSSYEIPWDALASSINFKTRLIMINSPHNPTGMVWNVADLDRLALLVKDTDVLIISDEVYEHMVYDGAQHHSVASHPALATRSFLISSFGKTYHVTGWKVGYVAAPAELSREFRKVHQFNVFTVNTPMQYGLASYLSDASHYLNLPQFYQAKRDFFRAGLEATRFKLLPTPGTYFQCADYSRLNIPQAKLSEADFCQWLTKEIGVAAIPVSAFYERPTESGVIRFCFAKQEQTLANALERLQKL
ncbi:pyridoxal phosphate-dependent aminotransferase [Polynucleobacter sp. 15G-AUS-farblos]|uniref:pyridoxal phosphate-dependent aminotransferase n=1 Tax=Polynucleobacter sp. 15G-AUS-farblos TaxID=2689094 RepID=UPI001C0BCB38|nr:pyridoxal phosphate-dependent aminotransferase [Polynucleobacter sp. 15G-AUS-farblos]MBU3583072.1 pyridoxal phosphate-dependent aminotransferase [Polynucleobacter sp. 15G-AUS-farblos]